jgi:hypothetical protein
MKMFNKIKKTQVSLFIIFGLVLFIIIILMINLKVIFQNDNIDIVKIEEEIDVFIYNCLLEELEKGVFMLSIFTDYTYGSTRYLIYKNSLEEHDIEIAKFELIKYMVEKSNECIDKFPNKNNLIIVKKTPHINIIFNTNNLRLIAENLYQIKINKIIYNSKRIDITIDAEFKNLHEISDVLILERNSQYIIDSEGLKTENINITVIEIS